MDQPTPALGVDELEVLFKFFPSNQLMELRQVSKIWNDGALPLLRKRGDLNLILTEDAERNRDFLECLRNSTQNGFVAAEMKLKLQHTLNGTVMLEEFTKEGSTQFQGVLTEICEILGTGQKVKRLILELQGYDRRLTSGMLKLFSNCQELHQFEVLKYKKCRSVLQNARFDIELLLRMICHLSPSLEILDMEESGSRFDFALSQETHDSFMTLLRNTPLNNLKKIVPPYSLIPVIRMRADPDRFNEFEKWINIVVESAPNLMEDPMAEWRRRIEEVFTESSSSESSDYSDSEDYWTDDEVPHHYYWSDDDSDEYNNYWWL